MKTTILNVEGMSCSHCVNAVTQAVKSLEGVSNVTVNLDEKTATVDYAENTVPLSAIKEAIEAEGYDVV